MTKEEFYDKIDHIRAIIDTPDMLVSKAIELLDELKDDAEQVLQDEYDEGYELGLNRGWNHEGMDCE